VTWRSTTANTLTIEVGSQEASERSRQLDKRTEQSTKFIDAMGEEVT
jgi:hypothetical protein